MYFNAYIEDDAGLLSGDICENVTYGFERETPLFSALNGSVNNSHVHFEKIYEPGHVDFTKVSYSGHLIEDSNEIEGSWVLTGPNGWSGKFMMVRKSGTKESLAVGRAEHKLLKA